MKHKLAELTIALVVIFALFPPHKAFGQQAPDPKNQSQGSGPGETGPKGEIHHVLTSQVAAWNNKDLEGFMAGYWRSPDLTFFSGGNIAQGWQAALERYQRNYQAAGKEMGHLEFQDLNIALLGERSAVVTGRWHLTMSDGKTPHGLFTLILRRFPDGWRIVHDHTSSAE